MMQIPPRLCAGAIMADPGVAFRAYSAKGEGRSPQKHYRCMPFERLAAVPIAAIAAPDCFLFLWIPLRSVFLVEPLMRAWGFRFSGTAFVWAKQNKNGTGWFMSTGFRDADHARSARHGHGTPACVHVAKRRHRQEPPGRRLRYARDRAADAGDRPGPDRGGA